VIPPQNKSGNRNRQKTESNMDFTLLEKAILDWIADRSDNAEIRMQIRSAYPAERELTGTGSFTKLAVPPHVPKTDAKVSMDPNIESDELDASGGCVLFMVDGKIDTLEIYTFGEQFEPNIKSWKLT
jgi:hypothetical protein